MELELISKAWEVDNNQFKEPWWSPEVIVHVEVEEGLSSDKMRKKAINKALNELHNQDFIIDKYGDELTYTNLRIRRIKECDRYKFGDDVLNKRQIDYYNRSQKYKDDLDKQLRDNPDGYAYINKGGNYYCSGWCGYTSYAIYAGVYTMEEAVNHAKYVNVEDNMRVIPINIKEHNKMIQDEINKLQDKLIPEISK